MKVETNDDTIENRGGVQKRPASAFSSLLLTTASPIGDPHFEQIRKRLDDSVDKLRQLFQRFDQR